PPLPAGLDPEARKVMVTQRVNEILERVWAPEASPSDALAGERDVPRGTRPRSTGLCGRAMPP
ncbi:MAG TPA: hypothetical protein VF469_06670, partial [Kofleriaceae bacterium]